MKNDHALTGLWNLQVKISECMIYYNVLHVNIISVLQVLLVIFVLHALSEKLCNLFVSKFCTGV